MFGNVLGLMTAAVSAERFWDILFSSIMFGALPVAFIIFLILMIVQIRKFKKSREGKGKLITFAVLTGVFLVLSLCELALMLLLAAAIAHM